MIALFVVYPIGIFLTTVFFVTLFIISAHRNAVARRASRPVTVVREYFDAEPPPPPPPAPKPKPVSPKPVPYMRRWNVRRQLWEMDEKARWDDDFKRLEK